MDAPKQTPQESPQCGELIVNFAPTGLIPTRAMSPHVPIAVTEIVEDVHRACEIGITVVHLHARDGAGCPTHDPDVYANLISGIRKFSPDLIIGVSLSGRVERTLEYRAQPLELTGDVKPDMGSLTLSSLNFNRQASVNEPEVIQGLAARMRERGIAPELEAFDAGMINYAHYLTKKGLISPPHYFNLLLGNIACAQPDLLHVGVMLKDLPPDASWCLGGVGRFQREVTALAVAVGKGVRIGLEDNIWLDRARTRPARNEDLLERVHALARAHERPIMSPSKLRTRLNLERGTDGKYGLMPPREAKA